MGKNHHEAEQLARMFLRKIEKGQYAMAVEFGRAAVAECIALQGPVVPADDSGMVGGAQ